MKLTCFGSRGSIPSPSSHDFSTVEFGGNTSCYYLEAGLFKIILDCGSGIRNLGNYLLKNKISGDFIVLLSHYHWDHIQGLPFCVPMFIAGNKFHFHGFVPSGEESGVKPVVERMLAEQQSSPHFPVAHKNMPSQKVYNDHPRQFSDKFAYHYDEGRLTHNIYLSDPKDSITDNHVRITTIPLNHPDDCIGYKIEYCNKTFVYATDNEPVRYPNAQLNNLARDCNLIVLDGQYTEEQIKAGSQTFGHGTPSACVEQAIACNAESLIIHHHDPANNDDVILEMEKEAMSKLHFETEHIVGGTENVSFAREGKVTVIND